MLANTICDSKAYLPEVPAANKTCMFPAMETVGKRIERLRKGAGWSRPELGRIMAEKIGRDDPFTGELIRQYELDHTEPPKDARQGLAKAFGRTEAYILFGDARPDKGAPTDAEVFHKNYLDMDPFDRKIVDVTMANSAAKRNAIPQAKKFRVVKKTVRKA